MPEGQSPPPAQAPQLVGHLTPVIVGHEPPALKHALRLSQRRVPHVSPAPHSESPTQGSHSLRVRGHAPQSAGHEAQVSPTPHTRSPHGARGAVVPASLGASGSQLPAEKPAPAHRQRTPGHALSSPVQSEFVRHWLQRAAQVLQSRS